MRLGLFMQPVHDPARDVHQLFMDDLEIAVYLDEALVHGAAMV